MRLRNGLTPTRGGILLGVEKMDPTGEALRDTTAGHAGQQERDAFSTTGQRISPRHRAVVREFFGEAKGSEDR